MSKSVLRGFLGLALISAFTVSAAFAGNTDNEANVAKVKKLVFGQDTDKDSMKLEGKSSAGKRCSLEVKATRFGVEFDLLDEHQGLHAFRVSQSVGTSRNYKMKI